MALDMTPTKVTMLDADKGAVDGVRIVNYAKGDTPEVPAHLAEAFYGRGTAEPLTDVEPPKEPGDVEPPKEPAPAKSAKAKGRAPENKAAQE